MKKEYICRLSWNDDYDSQLVGNTDGWGGGL